MNQLIKYLKCLLISILMLIFTSASGQFASGIKSYIPAPGQYTNAQYIGTPEAASSLIGTNRGILSLGSFGGSITLHFADGIKNETGNPYGVDFTIFGNPSPTWSEPGIVQVMKDENKNGLADDIWYEIAGSEHFWNSTIKNYEVTYLNNGLNSATDIEWLDNQGKSGIIPKNSFHLQSYYPSSQYYPQIPGDQYKLSGTCLKAFVDLSNPGEVITPRKAFGYADNTTVVSTSTKLPDNPYTSEIEGSGGDAIDIDWAADSHGESIHLDEIHFIRIYTSMNAIAGWLGEISTEITGIRDVEPAAVSGPRSMIVMEELPSKMAVGQRLDIHALFFESGKKVESTQISWSLSDTKLASIEGGKLVANKAGTFRLTASLAGNQAIKAEKEIQVFAPGKAIITLASKVLNINDKLELSVVFTDQSGKPISGLTPKWTVSDSSIADLVQLDGKFFLQGHQTGFCKLTIESKEIKSIRDSVQIQVLPESVMKKVFISVKTSEKTLIPRHSVWVKASDFTRHVDRTTHSYALTDTSFISLAHVIAALFHETETAGEWAFRDDGEGGNALYLWRVPEIDEGSMVYHSGYGGSRASASMRKTWIVTLNQQACVNGLDKIKVNSNDEVLVYQIPDNNLPWTVTHLTANADSLKLNQKATLQLMKYDCSMNADRSVVIHSSEVLAYHAVQIEMNNQTKSAVTYKTDEFGKLELLLDKPGDYLLSAGMDVLKLNVETVTSNQLPASLNSAWKVYPNPFSGKIRIECGTSIHSVEITDLQGRVIYSKPFTRPEIDLSSLNAGIYLLRIKNEHEIFQQKIIKH